VREEFLVCALLAQLAFVHDEDGVGALDGGETVRDEDGGAAGNHALQCRSHAKLGLGVDGGGGFVEYENPRAMSQSPCKTDELLLAGGERGAALEDGLGEGAGQGADEVADVDLVGGVGDFIVGDPGGAHADVLGDVAGEEEGILQDDAEAAAEGEEVLLADVDAVDEDLAKLDVVEAHHERGEGGFAGTGVADDGGGLVGVDGEGDVAENPFDFAEERVGVRGGGGGFRVQGPGPRVEVAIGMGRGDCRSLR